MPVSTTAIQVALRYRKMLQIYAKAVSNLADPITTVFGIPVYRRRKAVATICEQLKALARRIKDILVMVESATPAEKASTLVERQEATAASNDCGFQRFISRLI
jgi:hypothetical protein